MEEKPKKNTKNGQIKQKINQTDKIKWSIFTEAETRVACNKASDKMGLKLNEWIDEVLREKSQEILTFKPLPPARAEDLIIDLFDKLKEEMQIDRNEQMKVLEETLRNRPNTLWQWLGFNTK